MANFMILAVNPENFPEGLIELDSEPAQVLGFTSDKFTKTGEIGSQLFKRGNCVYIQAVEVIKSQRRRGHFNSLLQMLWSQGFTVKVPNPLPSMCKILKKKGFEETSEQSLTTSDPDMEVVLVKAPPRLPT